MELFMQFVAVPVLGIMPFTISLLVCWMCSSWRRWIAVFLSLISGAIFLFELYSASVGGNLTGLIWMLSLPILAIAFLVLYSMEKLSRHLKKTEARTPVENQKDS